MLEKQLRDNLICTHNKICDFEDQLRLGKWIPLDLRESTISDDQCNRIARRLALYSDVIFCNQDPEKDEGFIVYCTKEQHESLKKPIKQAREKYCTERYRAALICSCLSAFSSAFIFLSYQKDLGEFFAPKNCEPMTPLMQAICGAIIGFAYGVGGDIKSWLNYKKSLAGIISAEIAMAGTYLASLMIENTAAKLVTSAGFLLMYINISATLLSNDRLENAPGRG